MSRQPPSVVRPYLIAASIIFAAAVGEGVLGGAGGITALLIRTAWSLSMVGMGLLRAHQPRVADRVGIGFAVWNSFVCAVLAHLTGGLDTPPFYGMIALPLIQSAFIRDRMPAAVLGAVANFVGGMTVVAIHSPALLPRWGIVFAAVGASAVQASLIYRSFASAERAKAEQAVRQAHSERLAAIGRMAAAVAHEVNNPLAYVRTNLNFVRAEVRQHLQAAEVRTELLEVLDETATGLDAIERISSDLRGLARERAEEPKPMKVASTVEQALRIVRWRMGPRVRVSVTGLESLPEVHAAPGRLAQVLINLLANAGDALAGRASPEVHISASVSHDVVTVAIEDNGPGLPEGWETRLFQAFFTTKPEGEGTGLGLSLSRHYVESFGGSLWAEQREGGGARFVVALPVAARATAFRGDLRLRRALA